MAYFSIPYNLLCTVAHLVNSMFEIRILRRILDTTSPSKNQSCLHPHTNKFNANISKASQSRRPWYFLFERNLGTCNTVSWFTYAVTLCFDLQKVKRLARHVTYNVKLHLIIVIGSQVLWQERIERTFSRVQIADRLPFSEQYDQLVHPKTRYRQLRMFFLCNYYVMAMF